MSVFSALNEQLSFAAIVVFGVRRSSPLFREVQAHAEWPGELIRIVPLARSGERAVDRDLAGVDLASDSTQLTNNANDIFAVFRDGHSINDQCSVVTLDRFGNAFRKYRAALCQVCSNFGQLDPSGRVVNAER